MAWIRKWWVQPDHFRWLSGYLGYRNLRGFTRRMMATVVASLGAVPMLTMAVMWLVRWPTRRQSVLFVLASNACIAATCLVYAGPGMSLSGCTAFAALAGYVAFFHTSRYLALVLSTATAISAVCAVEMAMTGGVRVAVANLLIIAVGVLAVPFSVHVLVHLLGDEALKSHTDPLTGLRNRRGFYRSSRELLGATVDATEPYLTVIMLDLDRFKQVNDTRATRPATGSWLRSPTNSGTPPAGAPSSHGSTVRSS